MEALYKELRKYSLKQNKKINIITAVAIIFLLSITVFPLIYILIDINSKKPSYSTNDVAFATFIVFLFWIPILITFLIKLIHYFKNDYFKFIREKRFNEDEVLNDIKLGFHKRNIILGKKYIIPFMSNSVDIYEYEEIVWAFLSEELSTLILYLLDNKGKYNRIIVGDKPTNINIWFNTIDDIALKNPNLIKGYNRELEQLVSKNINNVYTFNKDLIDKDKIKLGCGGFSNTIRNCKKIDY